jgi:hypothetical protein
MYTFVNSNENSLFNDVSDIQKLIMDKMNKMKNTIVYKFQ